MWKQHIHDFSPKFWNVVTIRKYTESIRPSVLFLVLSLYKWGRCTTASSSVECLPCPGSFCVQSQSTKMSNMRVETLLSVARFSSASLNEPLKAARKYSVVGQEVLMNTVALLFNLDNGNSLSYRREARPYFR